MILGLEQDTQFLSGGYFAFSGYPTKKKKPTTTTQKDSTNRRNTLALVRNNKNPKIAQNRLTQEFRDGKETACEIWTCPSVFLTCCTMNHSKRIFTRRGHQRDPDRKRGFGAIVQTTKSLHALTIFFFFFLYFVHPSLAFDLVTRRNLAH